MDLMMVKNLSGNKKYFKRLLLLLLIFDLKRIFSWDNSVVTFPRMLNLNTVSIKSARDMWKVLMVQNYYLFFLEQMKINSLQEEPGPARSKAELRSPGLGIDTEPEPKVTKSSPW
jgi:hypothetical protein